MIIIMSTFKILPHLSSSVGLLTYNDQFGVHQNTTPSAATILNIITGAWSSNGILFNLINGVGGSATSGSVNCLPDANKISLNGGAYIDENHLPPGFTVLTAVYTPGISAPLTTNTSKSYYGAANISPAAVINF